jgi:hypothetical protein
MAMENVIVTIRRELIRSISGLDSWFDMDDGLMEYRPSSGNWSVCELLEAVMLTNRLLLDFIDRGNSKSVHSLRAGLEELHPTYFLQHDALWQAACEKSIELVRYCRPAASALPPLVRQEIREQLDRCLIHLELLQNGEGVLCKTGMVVDGLGELDVYQVIYFLALHVKCHLPELQKILEGYDKAFENAR